MLKIYALMVSFITIMILIVTIPFSVRNAFDILLINDNKELLHYNNDEEYLEYKKDQCRANNCYSSEKVSLEIFKDCMNKINLNNRLKDKEKYIKSSLLNFQDNLITLGIWQFFSLIFFFIHLRILKKYN